MKISILKADITTLKVDAIVNAANSQGFLGGGVAGAIKRRGGQVIEDEAVAKGPTPVGQALSTTAGTLPCRAIIHAPTMELPGSASSSNNVLAATTAALMLARDLNYRRIAIPGMGTGVGGVSRMEAAHAIVRAVKSFADEIFDEVILADVNEEMIAAFKGEVEK